MDRLSFKRLTRTIKMNLLATHIGMPTSLFFYIQMEELLWALAKVQMACLLDMRKHMFHFDGKETNLDFLEFQKLKEAKLEETTLIERLLSNFF
jgi:hypothetical protein